MLRSIHSAVTYQNRPEVSARPRLHYIHRHWPTLLVTQPKLWGSPCSFGIGHEQREEAYLFKASSWTVIAQIRLEKRTVRRSNKQMV
jgi:hypothetical protein